MRQFLLGVVLALCCSAMAAEKESSWQNLSQLRAGQKVEVVATNLAKYKGRFVRFDELGITLLVDKNERTIAREQVARVSSASHRVRNGILLSLAGFTAGGMAAVRLSGVHTNKYDWVMPAGIAAGAITGVAIPSGKTYFRAKKPDVPPK